MTSVVLYGIPNCDQVRKARKLLKQLNVDYHFHDFRKDGLELDTIKGWCKSLPWDALLNRRGRSWRELEESARLAIVDQQSAADAMVKNPTLIKRPVFVLGDHVLVGYNESQYQRVLAESN